MNHAASTIQLLNKFSVLCSETILGCGRKFTHANRHCAFHPKSGLIRVEALNEIPSPGVPSPEVSRWLQRFVHVIPFTVEFDSINTAYFCI